MHAYEGKLMLLCAYCFFCRLFHVLSYNSEIVFVIRTYIHQYTAAIFDVYYIKWQKYGGQSCHHPLSHFLYPVGLILGIFTICINMLVLQFHAWSYIFALTTKWVSTEHKLSEEVNTFILCTLYCDLLLSYISLIVKKVIFLHWVF